MRLSKTTAAASLTLALTLGVCAAPASAGPTGPLREVPLQHQVIPANPSQSNPAPANPTPADSHDEINALIALMQTERAARAAGQPSRGDVLDAELSQLLREVEATKGEESTREALAKFNALQHYLGERRALLARLHGVVPQITQPAGEERELLEWTRDVYLENRKLDQRFHELFAVVSDLVWPFAVPAQAETTPAQMVKAARTQVRHAQVKAALGEDATAEIAAAREELERAQRSFADYDERIRKRRDTRALQADHRRAERAGETERAELLASQLDDAKKLTAHMQHIRDEAARDYESLRAEFAQLAGVPVADVPAAPDAPQGSESSAAPGSSDSGSSDDGSSVSTPVAVAFGVLAVLGVIGGAVAALWNTPALRALLPRADE